MPASKINKLLALLFVWFLCQTKQARGCPPFFSCHLRAPLVHRSAASNKQQATSNSKQQCSREITRSARWCLWVAAGSSSSLQVTHAELDKHERSVFPACRSAFLLHCFSALTYSHSCRATMFSVHWIQRERKQQEAARYLQRWWSQTHSIQETVCQPCKRECVSV